VPTVVVGVNATSELFIRATSNNPNAAFQVIAVLDWDGRNVGRSVHRVPVMGKVGDAQEVVECIKQMKVRPQRILISEQHPRFDVEGLFSAAESLGLGVAYLPSPGELLRSGKPGRAAVNDLTTQDLLRRPMVVLNDRELRGMIEGRRVLVTGAGGSIGSELCKQIAQFKPAELVMLDLSEYNLYTIGNQISEVAPELRKRGVLADIRDAERIRRVFDVHRPAIVFHAAALKHVHLVESNPDQGLLTNTIGTRNIADAAIAAGALAFVQISTDKAVNPAGLMGASKRLAEYYTQSLDLGQNGPLNGPARTKFVTVRFGNVLGSSGSVVPLFQRQLEKGGPLTVTHPDMKRYFMTIGEAVSLVLQASAYGIKAPHERGRVLVLDMGQPVRVLEIARQMIKMAGYRPDEDIKIEFIGLRPGEKLEEELFDDSEDLIQTDVAGILSARPVPLPLEQLQPILNELADLARSGAVDQLKQRVAEIVPGCRFETEPTDTDVEKTVSTQPCNSRPKTIPEVIPAIAGPHF